MHEERLSLLGSRLRAARVARAETQQEVARAVNIHRTHLSRIESGQENITLETLWALGDHFGMNAAQLLADDDLKDAIDELVATRGAATDLPARTRADAAAQELIDEALNRGLTHPLEVTQPEGR